MKAIRRRRPRHDGHIRQRADGRWEARLDLGWRSGKRASQSFYGQSEQGVRKQLDEAKRRLDAGEPVTSSSELVRTFVNDWLDGAKPRFRPRAFHSYRETLDRHVLPYLGAYKLCDLTCRAYKPGLMAAWPQESAREPCGMPAWCSGRSSAERLRSS